MFLKNIIKILKYMKLIFIACLFFFACSSLPTFAPPVLSVVTTSGTIIGKTVREGRVRQWRGIPYAAPPTGNNRFRPPQLIPTWTTQRDAFNHGSYCTQWNMFVASNPVPMIGQEDCLYANVWSPIRS
jgi:para-nitrobenzyl esterase